MAAARRTPTFHAYGWAEHAWLQYPTSRDWHRALAETIIKNSPMAKKAKYMGAYYIPLNHQYIGHFADSKMKHKNMDIIYVDNPKFKKKPSKTKTYGKNQNVFLGFEEFAKNCRPPKGKIGVYFFGELHDDQGFIHWNVGFLYPNGEMHFFDPVLDEDDAEEGGYDFDSRPDIAGAFGTEPMLILTKKRPQWVCESDTPFTDLFCQTWTLLFLDVWCNGLVNGFLTVNFSKYQTEVVKTWLVCTINKFKRNDPGWDLLDSEELGAFPYYLERDKKGKPVVTALSRDVHSENCAKLIVESFQ